MRMGKSLAEEEMISAVMSGAAATGLGVSAWGAGAAAGADAIGGDGDDGSDGNDESSDAGVRGDDLLAASEPAGTAAGAGATGAAGPMLGKPRLARTARQ